MELNIRIGERLKGLRKERNWTQEKTAEMLNLSQSTYARIESGDSHTWATYLDRICHIFDVSPAFIICGDQNLPDGLIADRKVGADNVLEKSLISQYEEKIKEFQSAIDAIRRTQNY